MKSWQEFKNEIHENVPANAGGDGGSQAMGDTDVKSKGGVAGYDPILGTTARRKNPLDARTKEFKGKMKKLNQAREKRERIKLEKKWGINLKKGY